MNVLIACEESQRVCTAFRVRGHNAFSCDIQECSGGHPEWHIKGDVAKILNADDHGNNCLEIWFDTCDGKTHFIKQWDMIIAHPPCTYLTVTGNRWFNVEHYGNKAIEREREREQRQSSSLWLLQMRNVRKLLSKIQLGASQQNGASRIRSFNHISLGILRERLHVYG